MATKKKKDPEEIIMGWKALAAEWDCGWKAAQKRVLERQHPIRAILRRCKDSGRVWVKRRVLEKWLREYRKGDGLD